MLLERPVSEAGGLAEEEAGVPFPRSLAAHYETILAISAHLRTKGLIGNERRSVDETPG